QKKCQTDKTEGRVLVAVAVALRESFQHYERGGEGGGEKGGEGGARRIGPGRLSSYLALMGLNVLLWAVACCKKRYGRGWGWMCALSLRRGRLETTTTTAAHWA